MERGGRCQHISVSNGARGQVARGHFRACPKPYFSGKAISKGLLIPLPQKIQILFLAVSEYSLQAQMKFLLSSNAYDQAEARGHPDGLGGRLLLGSLGL